MASATTVAATGVLYGTEGYIPKFGTGGDGLYPSLLFQSGSRMGINTATPGYTLDVAGTGNLTGLRFPTNPLL